MGPPQPFGPLLLGHPPHPTPPVRELPLAPDGTPMVDLTHGQDPNLLCLGPPHPN